MFLPPDICHRKIHLAMLPRPQIIWLCQPTLAALGVAPRLARRYAQRKAGIADDQQRAGDLGLGFLTHRQYTPD